MSIQQIILGFGIAFLSLFAIVNAERTINWINSSSDPGWMGIPVNGRVMVSRVRGDGPASGLLEENDEVVLYDQRSPSSQFTTFSAFERLPVGSSYSLTVERNGVKRDFKLSTSRFTSRFWIGVVFAVVMVPAVFLISAVTLLIFSRGERRAMLLALALALTIPEIPFFSLANATWWTDAIIVLGRPLTFLAFPVYFHFSLIYPQKTSLMHRFAFLKRKRYIYAPYVVVGFLLSLWITATSVFNPEKAFLLRNSLPGYMVRYGVILIYVAAMMVVLIHSHKSTTGEGRAKVRLIIFGVAIGFGAIFVRSFILLFGISISATVSEYFVIFSFAGLSLLPLYFLVAIARRQLVAIREPAKHAAQYLGLRLASVVLVICVVLAVVILVLIVIGRMSAIAEIFTAALVIALTTILVTKLVEKLERFYVRHYVKRRSIDSDYNFDQSIGRFVGVLRDRFREFRPVPPKKIFWQELRTKVMEAIRSANSIEGFGTELARSIQRKVAADNVVVFLEDKDRNQYKFLSGVPDGFIAPNEERTNLVIPSDSSVTVALKHRRGVRSEPINSLERRVRANGRRSRTADKVALSTLKSIGSSLLLPVHDEDQLRLIISISKLNRPFGKLEKKALKGIVPQIASELEFVGWKKVVGASELTDVLDNILTAAVGNIRPAQKGSIYLWDHEKQRLFVAAQFGYAPEIINRVELMSGEGYAGHVFASSQPLIVPDFQRDDRGKKLGRYQFEEINSALLIPLQAWGSTIGVLCLDNLEDRAAFEEKHLKRVMKFASLVSLVVQNVRVQTELRNLGSTDDRKTLDCKRVLQMLLEKLLHFTEVKAARVVLLLDPHDPEESIKEKPLLNFSVGFSNHDDLDEESRPRADGLGLLALREKHPIWVSNPEQLPGINENVSGFGIKAAICFPFEINEFMVGLLYFYYKASHDFVDAEVEALRLFANETSLAFGNALKREELDHTDKVVWMALLTSSLSHDMNQSTDIIDNDLHTIEALLDSVPTDDPNLSSRLVSRIRHYIERIQSQRRELADAGSELIKTDLNKIICEEVRRGCQAHSNINVEMADEWCNKECYVSAIPIQVRLVVRNLISNAVRAAKASPESRIVITRELRGKRVEIQIANTGDPIPKGVLDRLFKEIVTGGSGSQWGHGIGLWIGKRILRRHRGDLDLIKSDESGTAFKFWLPVFASLKESQEVANGQI